MHTRTLKIAVGVVLSLHICKHPPMCRPSSPPALHSHCLVCSQASHRVGEGDWGPGRAHLDVSGLTCGEGGAFPERGIDFVPLQVHLPLRCNYETRECMVATVISPPSPHCLPLLHRVYHHHRYNRLVITIKRQWGNQFHLATETRAIARHSGASPSQRMVAGSSHFLPITFTLCPVLAIKCIFAQL